MEGKGRGDDGLGDILVIPGYEVVLQVQVQVPIHSFCQQGREYPSSGWLYHVRACECVCECLSASASAPSRVACIPYTAHVTKSTGE